MDSESMQDRMKAAMLFVAIGDALGMPAEIYSAETIRKKFGKIERYVDPPKDHRFHGQGMKKGMWTDDWCHTQACAESIVTSIGRADGHFSKAHQAFDCDEIAKRLVADSAMLVNGMGGSTREALERIRSGVSSKSSGTPGGAGNGVAMKAAPFGILLASVYRQFRLTCSAGDADQAFASYRRHFDAHMIDLALMTHTTRMGAASGLAQAYAVFACLTLPKEGFEEKFLELVIKACGIGESIELDDTVPDRISKRLEWIADSRCYRHMSVDQLLASLGKGSCYAYDSLPFTYAMFLRNTRSIETLYDTVNAGGDTDSNASMVGALLGARNGMSILDGHEHLVEGLWRKEEVLKTANELAETLVYERRKHA